LNNKSLQRLHLGKNKIGDEGASAILSAIQPHHTMMYLLENKNITDVDLLKKVRRPLKKNNYSLPDSPKYFDAPRAEEEEQQYGDIAEC
jgi:hypothetical protein